MTLGEQCHDRETARVVPVERADLGMSATWKDAHVPCGNVPWAKEEEINKNQRC